MRLALLVYKNDAALFTDDRLKVVESIVLGENDTPLAWEALEAGADGALMGATRSRVVDVCRDVDGADVLRDQLGMNDAPNGLHAIIFHVGMVRNPQDATDVDTEYVVESHRRLTWALDAWWAAPSATPVLTLRNPMPAADICRANGWGPGTCLAGNEGNGVEVIEITAIGTRGILARKVSQRGQPAQDWTGENSWTLSLRDWKQVPRPAKAVANA